MSIPVVTDISARKPAENAIDDVQLILDAVQSSHLGLWEWDIRTNHAYFSEEWKRQIGYQNGEIEDHYKEWEIRLHSDDRARVLKTVQYHINNSSQKFQLEYRLRHNDHSYRWVSCHSSLLKDKDGMPYRMLGSHVDITAQKEAEAKAEMLQEKLAHFLRLGTVNEMASGLAHELSQPLSAIANYCDAGLSVLRSDPRPNKKLMGFITNAYEQTLRASDLIHHLRRFISKRKPEKTLVDLNPLIKDTVRFIEPELQHNSVAVNLDLSQDSILIMLDKIEIQQVLVNLARNSIQAMERAKSERRLLTISTIVQGRATLRVTVQDTGPGVDTDNLDKLFEPFQTSKAEGIGMGLPICQSIVKAHGGTLWTDVASTTGATFHFTLPCNRHE